MSHRAGDGVVDDAAADFGLRPAPSADSQHRGRLARALRAVFHVERVDERIDRVGIASIGIMSNEITNDDVKRPGTLVIRPDSPVVADGLVFDPEEMKRAREVGRRKAEELLG